MKIFYKAARRSFSSTQFHHGLEIENVPKFTRLNVGLLTFEMLRITFYFFLAVKLVVRAPSYLAFNTLNFKKARNNPDYMLCDEKTFQQLNKH